MAERMLPTAARRADSVRIERDGGAISRGGGRSITGNLCALSEPSRASERVGGETNEREGFGSPMG